MFAECTSKSSLMQLEASTPQLLNIVSIHDKRRKHCLRSSIAGFPFTYTSDCLSLKYNNYYPADLEDARFLRDFMKVMPMLLEEKKIQNHLAEVRSGLEMP